MQRRENSRAGKEKRRPRTLTEWDFLLGVHDETRLGELRFQVPPGGPFIDSDTQFVAPPISSLRELQAASLYFEEHMNEEEYPEYEKWLPQLFAPGTSLGAHAPRHLCEMRQARFVWPSSQAGKTPGILVVGNCESIGLVPGPELSSRMLGHSGFRKVPTRPSL
jgi:hypothetical protein